MSVRYLVIPSTRKKVYEGDVIQLSRLPDSKWICEFGWYSYYNYQYSGWYLTGIPDGEVLPLNDEDLDEITVVSSKYSQGGCDCHHPQPSPGPGPKPPGPNIDRSWVTVDTIAQRDRLSQKPLPDGKIVRVNRTTNEGDPKYFIWNVITEKWDNFSFDTEGVDYLTKEEIKEFLEEKEIQKKLISTIQSEIEEAVPDLIKESREIKNLTQRVTELEEKEFSLMWDKLNEV